VARLYIRHDWNGDGSISRLTYEPANVSWLRARRPLTVSNGRIQRIGEGLAGIPSRSPSSHSPTHVACRAPTGRLGLQTSIDDKCSAWLLSHTPASNNGARHCSSHSTSARPRAGEFCRPMTWLSQLPRPVSLFFSSPLTSTMHFSGSARETDPVIK